jgi:protein involved in polysaccharide export with SLBB domain
MKRKVFLVGLMFMLITSMAYSQEDGKETLERTDINANVQIALSNPDYQVTAGDIYTLAYAAGGTQVVYRITVDSSYRIRVSNLGIINAAGKTYQQLKREVETVVTNNYPLSGVQFVLLQPAQFTVYVTGEVKRAYERSTWSLARLSSVTDGNLTAFSSIRDISVKPKNGSAKTYDLFKAHREGDLSQDPYLRPGDTITFNRIERVVTIGGAVERPGTYQLLKGEHVRELVEKYACGFTSLADKTRMAMVRYVGGESISGDKILFTEAEMAENFPLYNYDTITIPEITSLRPVMTVNRTERIINLAGAVRRPGTYNLMPDENLRDLIEVYGDGLTPLADKTRMELVRYVGSDSVSGDKIILAEDAILENFPLYNYDVITIPEITSLRPVMTVNRTERIINLAGAVRRPGTYNLMPDENLRDLIEVYGDGLTPLADKTRMELIRYVGSDSVSGDKIILTEDAILENFPLYNYDVITIPEITSLRPVMTVNRVERIINLAGAVRRPGTYNLMADENLRDLIEVYGDGLTPLADKTRIELVRYVGSSSVSGDKIILAEDAILENFPLYNYDVITIPEITSLRPVMTVNRVERIINLAGAVRRPGTYNLMPDENLRDLIEVYGDGLTPLADKTRIELVRYVDSESEVGDKIFLTGEDIEHGFPLQNYDSVTVPGIDDLQPVLFVEGAVGTDENAGLTASNRLVVRYNVGESYASLIRRNRSWFSAVSDTKNAYIIRGNEHIPINLNPMLYDMDYRADYYIETEDVLIIPFRQYFVTVAGAVVTPGRYPYIPDRTWEYYIALAGGFKPGQNSMESIIVADMAGKRMKKSDAITPETVITARYNSGLYYFNQIAPVITTTASLIMTFLSIWAAVGR